MNNLFTILLHSTTNQIIKIILSENIKISKNKYLWKLMYIRDNKINHIIKEYYNSYTMYYSLNKIQICNDKINDDNLNLKLKTRVYCLYDIFDDITSLMYLNILMITNVKQIYIPNEISLLINLNTLFINDNQTLFLPTEIGLLKKLVLFYIENNKIQYLPTEIGLLINLIDLSVHKNNLTNLPSEIGLLTNLRKITASKNNLQYLPTEIGLLHNLNSLDIHKNQFEIIPTELDLLKNLLNNDISTINDIKLNLKKIEI